LTDEPNDQGLTRRALTNLTLTHQSFLEAQMNNQTNQSLPNGIDVNESCEVFDKASQEVTFWLDENGAPENIKAIMTGAAVLGIGLLDYFRTGEIADEDLLKDMPWILENTRAALEALEPA
jgi:hypothetical protein